MSRQIASCDKRVKVEVPATSANLGAGFDCLGIALDLTNTLFFQETNERGLHVEIRGEGSTRLPKNPTNLAVHSFSTYYNRVGTPFPVGLSIIQENRVPLSGGLGSSATAILGGLLGARALSGIYMDDKDLLNLACEIEGHPDNVSPAFLGGLVVSVINKNREVSALRVETPSNWEPSLVIAVPDFELNTRQARSILQPQVSLDDAVYNLSRTALFVAAATVGRMDLLHLALEDRLHQKVRCHLIPGAEAVFEAAMDNGALGVCLSGSGPSIMAFSGPETAEKVGQGMGEAFKHVGLKATIIHTRPRLQGAFAVINSGCSIF